MTTKEEVTLPLMTVRQLARQGDVTVHVVRNYLRRGLLQAATQTPIHTSDARAGGHQSKGRPVRLESPRETNMLNCLRRGPLAAHRQDRQQAPANLVNLCGGTFSARTTYWQICKSAPTLWQIRQI